MPNDKPRPLLPPELTPPIRTPEDVCAQWRALMGELGFSHRTLWCLFLDAAGYPIPVLPTIEKLPAEPESKTLRNLLHLCRHTLEHHAPGGSVAFLLSRPGSGELTPDDRSWARGLIDAAAAASIRSSPVHLATDHTLRMLTADELECPRDPVGG